MQFTDYVSGWMEFKLKLKSNPEAKKVFESMGVRLEDGFVPYYRREMKLAMDVGSQLGFMRHIGECQWHNLSRPYFNVYPSIERKLMEIDDKLHLSDVTLPFVAMEVRTKNMTLFISDFDNRFLVVIERGGGDYQELLIGKVATIKECVNSPMNHIDDAYPKKSKIVEKISDEKASDIVHLVAGVCMLAKDKNIVVPVVLSADRRDEMTADEISRLSEKAQKRTGRVGFDVGREFEKPERFIHYRNGCFAKYYVGKDHPQFPDNATSRIAPIMMWRSGAIVGKDNIPRVPTGFHDPKPS